MAWTNLTSTTVPLGLARMERTFSRSCVVRERCTGETDEEDVEMSVAEKSTECGGGGSGWRYIAFVCGEGGAK